MTTGEVVLAVVDGDSWNCDEAGLEVAPGDLIRVTLGGSAQE